MTTTPWPKAISFALISPVIILQSANQSLCSMFSLLHGQSTVTRDKQHVWCMRSNHNLYAYTSFFELLLNYQKPSFLNSTTSMGGISTFII